MVHGNGRFAISTKHAIAHTLAKMALFLGEDHTWRDTVPDYIRDIVNAEKTLF